MPERELQLSQRAPCLAAERLPPDLSCQPVGRWSGAESNSHLQGYIDSALLRVGLHAARRLLLSGLLLQDFQLLAGSELLCERHPSSILMLNFSYAKPSKSSWNPGSGQSWFLFFFFNWGAVERNIISTCHIKEWITRSQQVYQLFPSQLTSSSVCGVCCFVLLLDASSKAASETWCAVRLTNKKDASLTGRMQRYRYVPVQGVLSYHLQLHKCINEREIITVSFTWVFWRRWAWKLQVFAYMGTKPRYKSLWTLIVPGNWLTRSPAAGCLCILCVLPCYFYFFWWKNSHALT